jgi:hypothetical protein
MRPTRRCSRNKLSFFKEGSAVGDAPGALATASGMECGKRARIGLSFEDGGRGVEPRWMLRARVANAQAHASVSFDVRRGIGDGRQRLAAVSAGVARGEGRSGDTSCPLTDLPRWSFHPHPPAPCTSHGHPPHAPHSTQPLNCVGFPQARHLTTDPSPSISNISCASSPRPSRPPPPPPAIAPSSNLSWTNLAPRRRPRGTSWPPPRAKGRSFAPRRRRSTRRLGGNALPWALRGKRLRRRRRQRGRRRGSMLAKHRRRRRGLLRRRRRERRRRGLRRRGGWRRRMWQRRSV